MTEHFEDKPQADELFEIMESNNEPVAWMQVFTTNENEKVRLLDFEQMSEHDIPLYTHPHPDNLGLALSIIDQQELKIEALKKNLDVALMIVNEPAKTLDNKKMIEVLMELAKYRLLTADEIEELAILRKAQEK